MIKTDLTTYEVVDLLSENLPFIEYVTTEEDLISYAGNWKSITTTNAATNFTVMDGEIWRELIEDAFSFTPDVNLVFDMRKDQKGYEAGMIHLLQTAIWMLEYFPGDAVLKFADSVVMHRKDGTISLSSKARKAGRWLDLYLSHFTLPYEWAELPESL